jgi:Fe2+ transport system protein FeoA
VKVLFLQSRPNESYTKVRLIWSQFSPSSPEALGRFSGVRLRVLSDLEVGQSGILVALDLPPGVQNHLMYMGFVPDARVKVLHRAPVGDPTVYSLDGIEIALRRETAKSIRVQLLTPETLRLGEAASQNHSEPPIGIESELVEAVR